MCRPPGCRYAEIITRREWTMDEEREAPLDDLEADDEAQDDVGDGIIGTS
jgi:hypothetical protein